jgi:hypothetical protein
MSINFTITDLKKELGPGLGLRKNKYLLEIPVPGIAGKKMNILCRSTSLPERNIDTVTVFSKGRRYKMRAETNYPGEYEISIVDDSKMAIRQVFDKWLKRVDNTKPKNEGFLGALGEDFNQLTTNIAGGLDALNTLQTSFEQDGGLGLLLNAINGTNASAAYQTDINIWQLDSQNNKVYGYKLQNAFPSSVGTVTLDDGEENTLSEFSVVFSYSEFIPLQNVSAGQSVLDELIGDTSNDILDGVESLFD